MTVLVSYLLIKSYTGIVINIQFSKWFLLLIHYTDNCLTRVYATLIFVFVIDDAESELAVLDLIQVLVEVLDKSFENVCELDLIFNPDKVKQYI